MSNESLPIKYRPNTLEDLVGQDTVVQTVRGMLKRNKPSRAMLIQGPYGSGKTTTARLIARYLNCIDKERKKEDPPCGECAACVRMANGRLTDYQEINAADTRGIDDIRKLIDASRYKPDTNYRIFVLDEVHQLTPPAFQAFLKVLEEPPSATIFILCTTDPQQIPSAIRSRCTKLNIDPVAPEMTVKALRRVVRGEKLDKEIFTKDLLLKIATAVEGHPRDAIATLEAVINNVEGQGTVDDIDAMVLDIAENVVGQTPDKIAATFLLGAYSGKFTQVLLTVSEISNHQAFAETLLNFHSHTMRWRFSPKLTDKMMFGWHAKLEEAFGSPKQSTLSPDALVEIMDLLLTTSTALKGYSVDGYYTMFNTAAKAVSICKRNNVVAKAA